METGNGIYIHDKPEEADQCVEWNFATLKGRGVYKGDLLSLYNHAPLWYGEGDERFGWTTILSHHISVQAQKITTIVHGHR